MLFLAEAKIDETFTDTQFKVNDFHFWHADRNQYDGGLVTYARSDLACDRRMNLEYQTIESICIEININNRKWLISGLYRPPSLSDSEFTKDYSKTFDKTTTKYENLLILGDLNYMLVNEKCTALKEVCDIFDLTNMVIDPTYFTKDASASLNDVILTNKPSYCMNTSNYNCGISDVHNIISIQMKGNLPSNKKE
jgi:exonuclease III